MALLYNICPVYVTQGHSAKASTKERLREEGGYMCVGEGAEAGRAHSQVGISGSLTVRTLP